MKDQDREAFEKWIKLPVDQKLTASEYREFLDPAGEFDFYIKVWQAACEYKDRQMINGVKMKEMNDRIESLIEENTTLAMDRDRYAETVAELRGRLKSEVEMIDGAAKDEIAKLNSQIDHLNKQLIASENSCDYLNRKLSALESTSKLNAMMREYDFLYKKFRMLEIKNHIMGNALVKIAHGDSELQASRAKAALREVVEVGID